ncbi:MAG: sn-glycerol-3-phosphate ABC transporter ATP-binding protein UgpC [Mesorhizobium sp.]
MAEIVFDNVSKTYEGGGTQAAVKNLNLRIADGEFVVLVGPSGCGKSTALRMIAGLEEITSGELRIGGVVANNLAPRDRDIAMVFQSYALYPHLSVRDNIGFGLRVRGASAAEIDAKVRKTAELLELTDFLDRKPARLSGGQRQRVAMGRALVREPNAFLMDEPLSNLDARLRGQMRAEIARLQQMSAVTTVYVTHDQVEAMTMGDRVAVMNRGQLQQFDAPRVLYDKPCNLFVASFIGTPPINFVRGEIVGTSAGPALKVGPWQLDLSRHPDAGKLSSGMTVIAGIRPETFHLTEDAGGLPATTAFVEDLGASLLLHLDSPQADVVPPSVIEQDSDLDSVQPRLRVVVDGRSRVSHGETLRLTADAATIHLFNASTGECV